MKESRYIVVKNPLEGYDFSFERCHAAEIGAYTIGVPVTTHYQFYKRRYRANPQKHPTSLRDVFVFNRHCENGYVNRKIPDLHSILSEWFLLITATQNTLWSLGGQCSLLKYFLCFINTR